jgi:hypothetical protein
MQPSHRCHGTIRSTGEVFFDERQIQTVRHAILSSGSRPSGSERP